MIKEIKHWLVGPQPLKKETKTAKLTLDSLPRDTSTRSYFINSMNLSSLGNKQQASIIEACKKFQVGHLVGLSEGGSNNPDNLVFQEKKENQDPGLKRQIERKNSAMMQSNKTVENTYVMEFDQRIPIRAPAYFGIIQTIKFRNGKLYQENSYECSNTPYLHFATMMRKQLVHYDLNESAFEFFKMSLLGGSAYWALSNQPNITNAARVATKAATPYLVKGSIKIALDFAQTSENLSPLLKNNLALLNINKHFNAGLNNLCRISSFAILKQELKKI